MTTSAVAMPVRRALLSVSDKRGIVELGEALARRGVALLSTGGTRRALVKAGLEVTEVAEHTGFPEIMSGRVKTLHPRIHGGILGREDGAGGGADAAVMHAEGIVPIDLVVVNLYPFQAAIADPDCPLERAFENVDIGGPAMVRAAAKNHPRVSVLVDPDDYAEVMEALAETGLIPGALRYRLAVKAFQHTAAYDAAIANWLGACDADGGRETFPSQLFLRGVERRTLRYGENPHQRAAFYAEPEPRSGTVGRLHQLQGKALSFNNLADTDAALGCVRGFEEPACVIVKHANPAGVAIANDLTTAYERAFATDPTSAFGGVIAFNRCLDAATAAAIVERQFVEVIVAPQAEPGATDAVARRRNVRLLVCGAFEAGGGIEVRGVDGGLLVQDRDVADVAELRVVTRREPDTEAWRDLRFAWRVASWVKSNAIVYARHGRTIGVGAGQMSRVYSARIAAIKAADEGLEVAGAVMASDAFFPFRDGIDAAAAAGVRAVIQPGGSVRDEEVIAAADEAGMAMVLTGMRHFRH